jgi:hypothetical protein
MAQTAYDAWRTASPWDDELPPLPVRCTCTACDWSRDYEDPDDVPGSGLGQPSCPACGEEIEIEEIEEIE